MSDLSIAGFMIKTNGDFASIGQVSPNGVTTTIRVSSNGNAKLTRCKNLKDRDGQDKNICLSVEDKNMDRHGVSGIAAKGLEQCHAAMKIAVVKAPLSVAVDAVKSCETMYALARGNELESPAENPGGARESAKLASVNATKPPEKPLKK